MDLQKSISTLRSKIDSFIAEATPEQLELYLSMASILSILNSEYGTIMRILDRQDKTNRLLFGNGNGDEGSMINKVEKTYGAFKFIQRALVAVFLALAVLMATKWYEGIKLNEIIAAQKVQAAKP